jgi:formylglycine-generating enzyme required for sulfatase activity
MVRIEAATFNMGSDSGEADEKPVHAVTLARYCIDVHEVTVADYRRCVDAGKCLAQPTAEWRGINDKDREFRSQSCNWTKEGSDKHPINCVDWRQSSAYCAFVKKRLPSEEEWEYAARGSDGRTFPWGNEAPDAKRLNACAGECVAWAKTQGLTWKPMHGGEDGFATTAPVGSFPGGKSPFGVEDMAGNVAEWTASGYSQDYSRERNNVNRVLRGGSARSETSNLVRTTNRHKNVATDRLGGIGFRCAM